jgi:peroxin-19
MADVDILDDFDSSVAGPSSSTAPATSIPEPSPAPAITDDDFAVQLQQGMEQLMREMESSSSARTEFESLVKQMSDATSPAPSKNTFSETLNRTMERMAESESAADAAQDEPQSETDAFLAEMLKQLDGAAGGSGEGGEAGMAKLLEGMMEQLMSKDILYEPMKDLQEKVYTMLTVLI